VPEGAGQIPRVFEKHNPSPALHVFTKKVSVLMVFIEITGLIGASWDGFYGFGGFCPPLTLASILSLPLFAQFIHIYSR
jgi:hypothetical protein